VKRGMTSLGFKVKQYLFANGNGKDLFLHVLIS